VAFRRGGLPPIPSQYHTLFWISVFRGFEVAFIRAEAGDEALSPRRHMRED